VTELRIALPFHLRTLAGVEGEVRVEVAGDPTIRNILDALEHRYPALRGTIRDHDSGRRRPFIRYFAAGQDISHEPVETRLPDPVVSGSDAFCVIGAISGG